MTKDDDFTPTGDKAWSSVRYKKKINDLAWVLANINKNETPEFIGLCEVENPSVLNDLAKSEFLQKSEYQIIMDTASCDARGIGMGFMYRSDALKNVKYELLQIIPSQKSEYELRSILYVNANVDDKLFHFFVNHWKSRRGGEDETEWQREDAALVLRKKIDEILTKDNTANIIIMGDMNDEPTNKSLYTVLRASNNTINPKNGELFNLMFDKDLNQQGSFSYNGQWNMLDNLIVSHNLLSGKGYRVTSDGGEIFADRRILYDNSKAGTYTPSKTYGKDYFGGYSDHLPVYFMLRK